MISKIGLISLTILLLNSSCKDANELKSQKREKKVNTEVLTYQELTEDGKITENVDHIEIAEKFRPKNSKIVHSVIKTDIWGIENAIIAFYESTYLDSISTTVKYERQYVEAYLYVLENKNWEKTFIYKFEDDNVFTEIQSVFFANVDQDKEKELIILSTCQHRLQYLYEGTEYSTSVFDNIKADKVPKQLTFLPKMSEKLRGGFEGFLEDNENSKAEFKNASEVKKELKRLGY